MKTGRPTDLRALELLCEILSDTRKIEETIKAEGYTVASSGGPKPHPTLRSLETQRRQAQNLMEKFDLLPDDCKVRDFYREETDDD